MFLPAARLEGRYPRSSSRTHPGWEYSVYCVSRRKIYHNFSKLVVRRHKLDNKNMYILTILLTIQNNLLTFKKCNVIKFSYQVEIALQ